MYFAVEGAEKVIAIEPSPESYQLLVENVNLNNMQCRIQALNLALTSRPGWAEFMQSSANPNADSIMPASHIKQNITFDSARNVSTTSLAEIIDRFHLEKIDLLKMDCEGCEYEVLANMPDKIWNMIEKMIGEYHDGVKNFQQLFEAHDFTFSSTTVSKMGYFIVERKSTRGIVPYSS